MLPFRTVPFGKLGMSESYGPMVRYVSIEDPDFNKRLEQVHLMHPLNKLYEHFFGNYTTLKMNDL